MRRATRILIVGLAAAVTAAGCTVKKTNAPEVTGPSELGTSLTLQAVPDVITQDGSSQSQVSILARDGTGQPIRNLGLRIEVTIGGMVADYGQLSSKNVVTGGDGRATVTYTAPPQPAVPVDTGTVVSLMAVPSGTDFSNAVARTVDIRLVPPGVILPPNGTPTARFEFSPSGPTMFSTVTFDGSASTDSDGIIVDYAWSFGDGSTGSGKIAQHQFSAPGEFVVTLTVTDDRNQTASTTKRVAVTESDGPTADFVFSPSSPRLNQDIYFNAAASKAAAGRTIVDFAWDFGSGSYQRGITVAKSYSVAGTYTVTLTVTDDVGQTGTISKTVTVSNDSGLSAKIVYSPTSPRAGQEVVFDGADSYSPDGIVTYEWEWGDGAHGAYGLTVRHTYAAPGTYVVRLTITDTKGRKATTTVTLTIAL